MKGQVTLSVTSETGESDTFSPADYQISMTKLLALAALASTLSAGAVKAADLPDRSRGEIEGLLSSLGTSSCQFYRNGSWHDGRLAEKHLRTKLEYLLSHGQIHNAEEFIAEAATKSSLSGEPYQVRCPSQPQQQSASWLVERLRESRMAPVSARN